MRTVSKAYSKKLDEPRALALVERTLRSAAHEKGFRGFLTEFLTSNERDTLAQRLRIAWLLRAGHSFRLIRHETGASLRTIAKIDRWLRKHNARYRRLIPIRLRRMRTHRRSSYGADAPLPGSIKHFARNLLGTDIF
ncbi:MAG: hypothetical protein G01um1014106_407 [Parcubacteria group bacterium Gr01-1014_106]|nr:MAG: hypothetical protein G01um1014106_407 [Parcubacteria group bacterium Gr01-1014_106]